MSARYLGTRLSRSSRRMSGPAGGRSATRFLNSCAFEYTQSNKSAASLARLSCLHPLHETIDHLFLAGLFERDGELVAVDLDHQAVAEFLVEHAVGQGKFRNGAGGFRDQLAFDGNGCALVAGEAAAGRVAARA